MRKRSRACEECHRLKIKCDVSTSPAGTCERCRRNTLMCVPAAPRLQRDRINDLEAQVEELKRALRDQESGTATSTSPESMPVDPTRSVLSFLDTRIPPSKQEDILRLFEHQAGAAWPIVHLPQGLKYIRAKSPILLLSILAFTTTHEAQGTELDIHDELVKETMRLLADEVISLGQRSLELVQAMLVATFWIKTTRTGVQVSCFQVAQLATDMAIDLGIAGFALRPSPVAYFSRREDPTALEAQRTWLGCFLALSTTSMNMRRPITVQWDAHHQACLLNLESRGETSDVLLCQIVRITKLIQEISTRLSLSQLYTFLDGNKYDTYIMIEDLKHKVDLWTANVPPSLTSSKTLKVWRHIAMIHIHELALHTPTNKASFAAPFVPNRIPVKDFPMPANIIPPLAKALEAIIENCHAVIDTVSEMEPALVLALPSFCFGPNVIYSLFVLLTVLVAATDPESTYKHCLPKDRFCIEQYGTKLRQVTTNLKSLDPTLSCYTTRLFDATRWLEVWFNDYSAILERYNMNLVNV